MKKGILVSVVALLILVAFGVKSFAPASPFLDHPQGSISSTTTIMPPAQNINSANVSFVPSITVTMTAPSGGGAPDPVTVYFYSYSNANPIYFTDNSGNPLTNVTYQSNSDGWQIYTINSTVTLTFQVTVSNVANGNITHILRGPMPDGTKTCAAFTASYVDNSGDIWAVLTIGDSGVFTLH